MCVDVGQTVSPQINPYPANALWSDATDFLYSASPSSKILISSGQITATNRGIITVTATHKVTNRTATFEVFVKNSLIDTDDYNALRTMFENQVGTGYANAVAYNYYTVNEALNIILDYDSVITDYCNEYRIPKEFVQSVLFREIWCYSITDDVADNLVKEYYAWKRGESTIPPIVQHSDSSTGLGQIFASTAIDALNHADEREFIMLDTQYDSSDWNDVWDVWYSLHTDQEYNLKCCALVILDCQYEYEETVPYENFFDYSSTQIKKILSRYNGTGEAAVEYGELCYVYYQIFAEYNQ